MPGLELECLEWNLNAWIGTGMSEMEHECLDWNWNVWNGIGMSGMEL